MKKLLFTSILFLSVLFSFAQTQTAKTENGKNVILNSDGTWKYLESIKDTSIVISNKSENNSIQILHAVDKMTDENYYSINNPLNFIKGDKKLMIKPMIDKKGNYNVLLVVTKNVGTCNQKNKLIFLFEDGSKYSLDSWNEFNCKGTSYFDLYGKALINLQKKVVNIMFQNGESFESITVDVSTGDQDYFIQVQKALDLKIYAPAHLEDGAIIKD